MLSCDLLMDMPFELRHLIASFDIDTWIKLALRDPELYDYTSRNRLEFVLLFTKEDVTIIHNKFIFHKWLLFGKKHREERDLQGLILPAEISMVNNVPGIHRKWYFNDKLHRDENDLPALVTASGIKNWYRHGKYYRANDMPTYVDNNGDQHWHDSKGRRHRKKGPAYILASGYCEWWDHGVYISSGHT